mmetsp:Transcript_34674/g.80935  ORF Transcript_34674/g.80935 Transcript_34674/m.80935 type:complete len:206 (-) Transcript_34674:123-740(-)
MEMLRLRSTRSPQALRGRMARPALACQVASHGPRTGSLLTTLIFRQWWARTQSSSSSPPMRCSLRTHPSDSSRRSLLRQTMSFTRSTPKRTRSCRSSAPSLSQRRASSCLCSSRRHPRSSRTDSVSVAGRVSSMPALCMKLAASDIYLFYISRFVQTERHFGLRQQLCAAAVLSLILLMAGEGERSIWLCHAQSSVVFGREIFFQ